MSSHEEIVTGFFNALATRGPAASAESMADDFRFIAGTVEVGRPAFLAILSGLYAAIPDLSHNLSDMQVRGDTVQLTSSANGSFTAAWDGTGYGLPVVPPSGSAFQMAPQKWEFTIRHGKITRLHHLNLPSPSSGLPGFFSALGTTLPPRVRGV